MLFSFWSQEERLFDYPERPRDANRKVLQDGKDAGAAPVVLDLATRWRHDCSSLVFVSVWRKVFPSKQNKCSLKFRN